MSKTEIAEIQVRHNPNAVALRHVVEQYQASLAELLPRTGMTAAAFTGFTRAALEKDEKLAEVAAQNPQSLLTALMKCAMLGHTPGSDQFALVAFGGKEPAVSGIEQYQGLIQRAQRAAPGLVVAAAIVRENDTFQREVALGEPVLHTYPPFATAEQRGKMIGVYAQARTPQGTYTQSVTLNPEQIAKYKALARTPRFWNAWPEEMAMKCAILRLRKFLPVSSEWTQQTTALLVAAQTVSDRTGAVVPDLDEHEDVDVIEAEDATVVES